MSITILDVLEARRKGKGREPVESYSGEDFAAEGLAMIGGCWRCEACLAAYNAHPDREMGRWACEGCLLEGFESVEQFEQETRRRRVSVRIDWEFDTNLDDATLRERLENFLDPERLDSELLEAEVVRTRETAIEVCGSTELDGKETDASDDEE